jgi:hypothetical protein
MMKEFFYHQLIEEIEKGEEVDLTELKNDRVKPGRGVLGLAALWCYPGRRKNTITEGQPDVNPRW